MSRGILGCPGSDCQKTFRRPLAPSSWKSSEGKRNIVLIASDHTRPVPGKVLVSQADPELVKAMKMHPARDLPQALEIAEELPDKSGSITVIPEGISTIII